MPQQLTMLDEPRARAKDPETSHLASKRRGGPSAQLIAAAVKQLRTATADDIWLLLDRDAPGTFSTFRSTIHGSVSRTAKLGLIVPCGRRGSPFTGSPQTVYRAA